MEEKAQSSARAAKEFPSVILKCIKNNEKESEELDDKAKEKETKESTIESRRKSFAPDVLEAIQDAFSVEISNGDISLSAVVKKLPTILNLNNLGQVGFMTRFVSCVRERPI